MITGRPAAEARRSEHGAAAVVLRWAATLATLAVLGAAITALVVGDAPDWAWLVVEVAGVAPALWAARRPSWLSGLALSTVGYVPLVYSFVGMLVLPVVLISTLVLVVRRLSAAITSRPTG